MQEYKKILKGSAQNNFKEISGQSVEKIFGMDLRHKRYSIFLRCSKGKSGKSKKLIYFSKKIVIIYFFKLDQQEFYFGHKSPVTALTISSKNLVASAEFYFQAKIYIWNVATKETLKILYSRHYSPIFLLEFFGKNRFLISCSYDGATRLNVYDLKRDETPLSFQHKEEIVELPIAVSKEGAKERNSFYFLSKMEIDLVEYGDKDELIQFSRNKLKLQHIESISCISTGYAMYTQGQELFLYLGHEDGSLTLWSELTFIRKVNAFTSKVNLILFNSDLGFVMQVGDLGLSIWDSKCENEVQTISYQDSRANKMPMNKFAVVLQNRNKLYALTDYYEIYKITINKKADKANDSQTVIKHRYSKLKPIPKFSDLSSEFYVRKIAGTTFVSYLLSAREIVVFNLEENDYCVYFKFPADAKTFDVAKLSQTLKYAVLT